MPWPLMSCGKPTTAASATLGWATSALSTSAVPMRCPLTLITSSTRPVIQKYPSSSRRAPSPVKYRPLKVVKYVCTKRSWSPYSVRICPGQLSAMHRLPSTAPSSVLPSASTSSGRMPGRGRVAEPGLTGTAPGRGEIRMPPVSVCHQVSTIGQRSLPTTR